MSEAKDKIIHAKDKVMGGVKEALGKATSNEQLELKGKLESSKSDLKDKIEGLKEDAAEKVNDFLEKDEEKEG